MSDYTSHLLPYLSSTKVHTLSCDHVIPAENFLAFPVIKGPSNNTLSFTYDARSKSSTLANLGAALLSLATEIPDGLVVFFPSYAYLETVVQYLKRKDTMTSIWDRLECHKPIFLESRVSSTDILRDYSSAIANGLGGLLFSVISGSLSEGLNFSDALGRGIVVVGLPYPNIHSAEWTARLEYINQAAVAGGATVDEGRRRGKEFVENKCLRAVNQCVGRAIRHREDWAVVLLLDSRWNGEAVKSKLPGWVRRGLQAENDWNEVMHGIQRFCKAKATGKPKINQQRYQAQSKSS